MKIILTTITLVAVLGIGLFGVSNVFAQGDGIMGGNDTGMMNATLAFAQGDGIMGGNDTGMMNATLAFAQGEGNDTMSMDNDTSMMMNATLPISIIGNDTAKP